MEEREYFEIMKERPHIIQRGPECMIGNKLAKLRRHASKVHFAKIHLG